MELHFGSPLVKHKIEMSYIDSLNQVGDQIISKSDLFQKLNLKDKLASAINQEFSVPLPLIKDFEKVLLSHAADYHHKFSSRKSSPDLNVILDAVWMVCQKEGEWNYLHSHSGAISGIVYLKVPSNMAEGLAVDDKRVYMAGGISFAEGAGNSKYRKTIHNLLPVVGDLYLFPSDLMHTVYPFFGKEERRSLSFNIRIED